MSYLVLVGEPTVAQRYVDGVLAAAGTTSSLPAVLLHCLNAHPEDLMMINGATDEHVTNGVMLARSLRVARMLGGCGGSGGVLMLGANSPALVAAELGSLFAGRLTLGLDVNYTTLFELEYFLKLFPPAVIFCDPGRQADVLQAVQKTLDYTPDVIPLGYSDAWLDACAQGCSNSLEGFTLPTVSPGDAVVLVPTTGSTGPPKAAMLHHEGVISHLLNIWSDITEFPHPYRRAMVFSTVQWIGFWTVLASSIVARVTVVMTSMPFDPVHAWEVFNKYEVEWALISPTPATRLLECPAKAKTLRRMLLAGSVAQESTQRDLQARLPQGGIVRQGYGQTECSGLFTFPDKSTPFTSVGKPLNIYQYKILSENGKNVGPNEAGELCIKSNSLITVSPEELEAVIGAVPGVSLSVVCKAGGGAAALVVRSDPALTRTALHEAVDSQLAPYKRLLGGIAFVASLPLTHSGKLHRRNCIALAEKLLQDKQLYV